MKTLLDPVTEAGTRFRVNQLQPHAVARWGRTTAPRVIAHLTESLDRSLAQAPAGTPPAGLLTRSNLLRWLYVVSVPCPDRRQLVVEDAPPADPAAFKADVHAWQEACSRFVARGRSRTSPAQAVAPHPVFGSVSVEEWGRLVYVHTDHHLRQFGV